VGTHAGEFAAEMLFSFIDGVIANARSRGTLNENPLELMPDEPTIPPGRLRYPGKVIVSGDRIAVADSGHHRILVGTLGTASFAKIDREIDGGTFNYPQGMAFDGDILYVADAGNHSIRAVNLSNGETRTVAGTGSQIHTQADRERGAMSSPWDVVVKDKRLYVAMAGTHQIWSVDPGSGSTHVHAGVGGEEIRDGDNANALLAQPMGITVYDDRLYFADAESNAVRWSETRQLGATLTVFVTGLFDLVDVDGSGDEVRLQHPQGITPHPDGGLLVADSYNDCIKKIDPETRLSEMWVRGLNEPSGISCSQTHAYAADTNAHRIAVIDLKTREVSDLRLE
jgi:DNA-binding beta-propeller fold protein YncE